MRNIRLFTLPGLFVLLSTPFSAAQTPTTNLPAASNYVDSLLAVAGWTLSNLPVDVEGTGAMITETANGATNESVVVKARPAQQVRVEFAGNNSILIVNGGMGNISSAQGLQPIDPQSASAMTSVFFPFYTIASLLNAPDHLVSYLGPTNVNGVTAYRIQLTSGAGLRTSGNNAVSPQNLLILTISADNFVLLKLDFWRQSAGNANSGIPVSCVFGDYRKVGNMLVPFHVDEYVAGSNSVGVQFETVQLNVGLTDDQFSVQQ
jgi:hypothetical protein